MNTSFPLDTSKEIVLVKGEDFASWESLNDSIMGGSSNAVCRLISQGLLLEGELVEEGGGFVSCRSEYFSTPLNLSNFKGVVLDVEGGGRTLKFAIGCRKRKISFSKFFFSNIRWVAEVPTQLKGITRIKLPFNKFEPAIRAKPVNLPISFDSSGIIQFQLLHSKFGQPGKTNIGFKSGLIRIILHSISVYT